MEKSKYLNDLTSKQKQHPLKIKNDKLILTPTKSLLWKLILRPEVNSKSRNLALMALIFAQVWSPKIIVSLANNK